MSELTYEIRTRIRSVQVDRTRKIRTSELFRLLQEASIAHTEALGCTRRETLDRGVLWVIARQSLQIEALPEYDDEVVIRSWPGEMMHVFFPRFYEVLRDGQCIVRGEAIWMMIDADSRAMVMPEDYGIALRGRPGSPELLIPAVTMPKGAEPAYEQEAEPRFSQIDINGHMNNARYFDLIEDRMPAEQHERTPKRILANYSNELRECERFTLRGFETAGDWTYEGASEKVKFRISLHY